MATDWRSSREYRIWRVTVILRDKTCQICGKGTKDGIVRHAHHLNSASYFIDERFDPENGVCLCSVCHINFHTNYKRSYRTKCTKYDFANMLSFVVKLDIARAQVSEQ